MEKWNELCYNLSENISPNLSEDLFELKVIQALDVLGWKGYKGDLNIRSSFQVGASKRLTPDIIVKCENSNLFVIEVKRPHIPLNSDFGSQLKSYMRQLKLDVGILIGQNIQIFYDGTLFGNSEFTLLDEIKFKRDYSKGLEFVELFSKENFGQSKLEIYVKNKLEKIENKELEIKLKKELLSEKFVENLKLQIKTKLLSEYNEKVVENVLNEISINIQAKQINSNRVNYTLPFERNSNKKENIENTDTLQESEILKIERKAPKWFRNTDNICSQILINFLELRSKDNYVDYDKLFDRCQHLKTFKNNFDQMRNFGIKNHGKVFEKNNSIVTIWEPVRKIIETEYEKYTRK